jgi:AcrR family transcriptional regulator
LLPRAERRTAILHSAAQAFASFGFAHTSMDDVAAACGVTKLIVYRHFDSKEMLYREILERVFQQLGDVLKTELARPSHTGLGPRTLLTVARDDPAAFLLLWRHASHEPGFEAYAEDLRAVAVTVVRGLMAIDSGDERLDAWRAEALFAWLVEATLTWLERGDPGRDDEFVWRTSAALRAMRESLLLPLSAVAPAAVLPAVPRALGPD